MEDWVYDFIKILIDFCKVLNLDCINTNCSLFNQKVLKFLLREGAKTHRVSR